jgi:Glycosyl transferase family 2
MILSILICTLESRKKVFDSLIVNLENQLMKQLTETVEILVKCDNGENTTGAKRDFLLRRSIGDYIVFVDDDDEVPPYYIQEIISAAKFGADCMAINGIMTTDGVNKIPWRLSKNNPNVTIYEEGIGPVYLRTTNHISPVRRDIAIKGGFPDIRNGEDKAYSESIHQFLKTEHTIIPPMYHYKFLNVQKLYK